MGFFLLFSAGKAMALTSLPRCNSDKDCTNGYGCVFSEVSIGSIPIGYCRRKITPTPSCKNLWWFDSSAKVCTQKKFCGVYVYQGLQTYATVAECQKNMPKPNCSLKKCGDANCDGVINSKDLLLWMRERSGSGKTSDFNRDGKVDTKDYILLKDGITGKCGMTTPTPYKLTPTPTSSVCGSLSYVNYVDECRGDKMVAGEKYYRNVEYSCGRIEGIQKMGGASSCKSVSLWKSYIESDCRSRCLKPTNYLPSPTKIISHTPPYTCGMLYKISLNGNQNYFTQCGSNGFAKVCFDKYTGIFQGCSKLENNDCTESNMNAERNMQCDSNMGVVPTVIVTKLPTLTPARKCSTDKDCLSGQVCYQPPMPVCPTGIMCAQVLPVKYCKILGTVTLMPVSGCNIKGTGGKLCLSGYVCVQPQGMAGDGGICVKSVTTSTPKACQFNGDADGDGRATLKDFAIWKYEYSIDKAIKADFNCDNKVDLNDYVFWRKAFLLTKDLMVITNN